MLDSADSSQMPLALRQFNPGWDDPCGGGTGCSRTTPEFPDLAPCSESVTPGTFPSGIHHSTRGVEFLQSRFTLFLLISSLEKARCGVPVSVGREPWTRCHVQRFGQKMGWVYLKLYCFVGFCLGVFFLLLK